MASRPKLVLASGSPRRLALLEQIGVEPDLLSPVDADETPLKSEAPRSLAKRLSKTKASIALENLKRSGDAGYTFFATDELGPYQIERGDRPPLGFAVNLFNEVESDLGARTEFETTWRKVEATAGFETTRREIWPWIVGLAIVILLAEWYIYNQRVYI